MSLSLSLSLFALSRSACLGAQGRCHGYQPTLNLLSVLCVSLEHAGFLSAYTHTHIHKCTFYHSLSVFLTHTLCIHYSINIRWPVSTNIGNSICIIVQYASVVGQRATLSRTFTNPLYIARPGAIASPFCSFTV